MLNQTKNHVRDGDPFYAPRRAGGKRAKITWIEKQWLIAISKAMSRGLRHYRMRAMNDEGWTPTQTLLGLGDLRALGAVVYDIYDVIGGAGGNDKMRFELSRDRCQVRCAQGHSVGIGVSPDCMPKVTNIEFAAHGTRLEAATRIVVTGLPRRSRLHIHFYECDRKGNILGGQNVRCGSDVAIAISARQCMDGGIVSYRSPNDVILSEGAGGAIGVQYFRFIQRLRRNPRQKRCIIRHPEGWADTPDVEMDPDGPQTMFTRENADEDLQTNLPHTENEDPPAGPSQSSTDQHDRVPPTPALSDIAGLNPFSSESEGSALTGVMMTQEEVSPYSENLARIAYDESYPPVSSETG